MNISELFSQAVGQVTEFVQTQDPVANAAIRFVGALQKHAFGPWSHVARQGIRCAVKYRENGSDKVRRCKSPSSSSCCVCRGPVCFDHGLFGVDGTCICRSCVAASFQRAAGSPPKDRESGEMSIDAAKKLLGLGDDFDESKVKAAYREKAAEAHPDRQRTEKKKERATRKFVELGRAKDLLLEHLRERSAA